MRRTFGGTQFTYVLDDLNGPIGTQGPLPHWVSATGVRLFCQSGLRGPLSSHWEIWAPGGVHGSGMDPIDAMQNAGLLPRPFRKG